MKITKECINEDGTPFSKEQFINKIKTDDGFAKMWGNLGPIYGAQWRKWRATGPGLPHYPGSKVVTIDQIQNSIGLLKTDPDSRRNRVSAWNVGELSGMVLPPCHTDFQFYTRELSLEERIIYFRDKVAVNYEGWPGENDACENFLDEKNIPKRAISLSWNQRSVDTFLGLPFNIASYGLLLEIIAEEVNMVPEELIGNLGDTHLYLNHIEQAKEQIGRDLTVDERTDIYKKQQNLSDDVTFIGSDSDFHKCFDDYYIPKRTREPYPLPTLEIKTAIGLYDLFEYLHVADNSDFEIKNYKSHPSIKAPLSN